MTGLSVYLPSQERLILSPEPSPPPPPFEAEWSNNHYSNNPKSHLSRVVRAEAELERLKASEV